MRAAEQKGGSFGQQAELPGRLLSLRSHKRAKESGSCKATDTELYQGLLWGCQHAYSRRLGDRVQLPARGQRGPFPLKLRTRHGQDWVTGVLRCYMQRMNLSSLYPNPPALA